MCAWLEELRPGDPGELSGCALFLNEGGKDTYLTAEIGHTPQRKGSPLCHCLGYLDTAEFQVLVERADGGERFTLALWDREWGKPPYYSGATLIFFGGEKPEMQLCFGSHCLGVLRGRTLTALLECAHLRLGLDVK
jgi:hypothetical protein